VSVVIGIDPGKSGAIAFLVDGRLEAVYDMPVVGNIISGHALANLITWNDVLEAGEPAVAVLEDVHAMPKQGVTSSFSFGRSLGVAEGVLGALGHPIVYVSAAKWKRALGLSADKGMCRRRAIELWPHMAAHFARVKDDGRAEAALIAHWYWTTQQQGGKRMTPKSFTPHDYAMTTPEGKAAVDAWCRAHDIEPTEVSLVEWPGGFGFVGIETVQRCAVTGRFLTDPDDAGRLLENRHFLNERTPFPWDQVATVEETTS